MSKRRTKIRSLLVLWPLCALAFFTGCNQYPKNRLPHTGDSPPGPPLTITATNSPAGADSREPDLTSTPDGRVILSWVEKVGDQRYALRFATWEANGWGEAKTVAQGENWFINWADFPSVIGLSDGSLAAHWLVKSGSSTYAYDVNIAQSKDGGKTWSKPVVPHTDKTQTEHGFVTLLPLADGRVGAIWLDGRNLKDMKHESEQEPLPASMTLRYAEIDSEGKLSEEAELDGRVCECCQTSAALTPDGVIATYRDRSETEVRDISYVRREQSIWMQPRTVNADNWKVNGCPVNGPSISAGDRRVVVSWFTGSNDSPTIQVAFSNDAGASFGAPLQVDDGEVVGRVDTILLPDGSALVCWLSGTVEGGAIKVRRVRTDGELDEPSVIAKTDISRSSGFPRMARLGDQVHFAWTEFGKPSYVRTATADVKAFISTAR